MNRSLPSKSQEKSRPIVRRRAMKSPQVKGKALDEVEFSTGLGNNSISLVFRDKTALHFSIEPVLHCSRNMRTGRPETWSRSANGSRCVAGCSGSREGWGLQGAPFLAANERE